MEEGSGPYDNYDEEEDPADYSGYDEDDEEHYPDVDLGGSLVSTLALSIRLSYSCIFAHSIASDGCTTYLFRVPRYVIDSSKYRITRESVSSSVRIKPTSCAGWCCINVTLHVFMGIS